MPVYQNDFNEGVIQYIRFCRCLNCITDDVKEHENWYLSLPARQRWRDNGSQRIFVDSVEFAFKNCDGNMSGLGARIVARSKFASFTHSPQGSLVIICPRHKRVKWPMNPWPNLFISTIFFLNRVNNFLLCQRKDFFACLFYLSPQKIVIITRSNTAGVVKHYCEFTFHMLFNFFCCIIFRDDDNFSHVIRACKNTNIQRTRDNIFHFATQRVHEQTFVSPFYVPF